jgi:hypothetical protein
VGFVVLDCFDGAARPHGAGEGFKMDIQGLVTATAIDPRGLIFRTPGGDPPKVVFDGHVALQPISGWNLNENGSFRLTYPPAFEIRAAI